MITEYHSARELAAMVKDQAILTLGPWPRDLQLMVFVTKGTWSCGLSPATQISDLQYRNGVIEIARELQKTVGVAS